MGWVKQEFEDRVRAARTGNRETLGEREFEAAAAERWRRLVSDIEADVKEYEQQGGAAEVQKPNEGELHVVNRDSGLSLILRADLPGHTVHYDFEAQRSGALPPIGGIFSLRPRYGRIELYSADERVENETVRRLLLEPVLFPMESAA